MRRILDNRALYVTLFVLFALALAVNGIAGGAWPAVVNSVVFHPAGWNLAAGTNGESLVAHGPTLPPDPWEEETPGVRVAHGPTLPPDPWEEETPGVRVAHGPTLPPDPWEEETPSVRVAHGPTLPPDPWEEETPGLVIRCA